MATSTINKPFKSYVEVAQTGATTDTWANKLGTLSSAISSMTNGQKKCAFLMYGATVANITETGGTFSTVSISDTGSMQIDVYDITTLKRVRCTIGLSGAITVTDYSNSDTSQNLHLCYRL